jgi:hypothetical protein
LSRAAQRRTELAADVAEMRRLGVLRWGSVWLGPPPPGQSSERELTPEELRAREQAAAQKKHDVLFAHSSVKPILRPPSDVQAEEDQARLTRVAGAKK